jgi:hypothetical protein
MHFHVEIPSYKQICRSSKSKNVDFFSNRLKVMYLTVNPNSIARVYKIYLHNLPLVREELQFIRDLKWLHELEEPYDGRISSAILGEI